MNQFSKQIIITISCDTKEEASIISGSLEPEIKKDIPETKIMLKQNNKEIRIIIQALQTNVLRAACNSYMRWIETALSISNINLD
jgi:tRNA threonylcarbamoyladenosine modification (KEOPS) complex  Pcc1 subunit